MKYINEIYMPIHVGYQRKMIAADFEMIWSIRRIWKILEFGNFRSEFENTQFGIYLNSL